MENGGEKDLARLLPNSERVNVAPELYEENEPFLYRIELLDDDEYVNFVVEEDEENHEVMEVKRREDGETIIKNKEPKSWRDHTRKHF